MRNVKIYLFNELSDKAKQIAIQKYRDNRTEYDWEHEARKSLRAFFKRTQGVNNCKGPELLHFLITTFDLSKTCELTGYCMDEALLDPIRTYVKVPDSTTTLKDLVDQATDSWQQALQKDYEYQDSDEYISEHLVANAYEFTEDGKRF